MKTIFRYINLAILLAATIAFGTVAGLAQDATPAPGPCEDAAGQSAASDKITELFKDKTLTGRMAYVEAGKTFLTKYGSCDSAKAMNDYLTPRLPKLEETIRAMKKQQEIDALAKPFDAAMKAKDWDKVYSLGKEILQKFPEEFRTVEIVLGSVGGEEALKNNFKYNDDALKYAKLSIADLEAKKPFVVGTATKYGIYEFSYKTPDEAIAWLNLYIGYITQVGQKNKAAALPYLYKATQANETKVKAAPYDLIGSFYLDELNKLYEEIQTISKSQTGEDTEEAAKQKLEAIKAKIALANGTAERVMDALARAANLEKDATVKARLRNTLQEIYKRRFEKTEGMDAWIAAATAKPFINPQTPIQPITDPEPVKPGVTTTTTTPPVPPVKPPVPEPKPATAPAAKPTAGTKPQATVKKRVVRKKTT